MSVLNHLASRASAAVLSEAEKTAINTSITTLAARLTSHFPKEQIVGQLRFGSSTRGTILPRSMDEHSDIDYLVEFANDGSTPQTYLNRLKRFVDKYYSASEVYQDSPTIVLEMNHIKFDLVPATKDWWSGLRIPDGKGGWRETDPTKFNDELETKNKQENSLIKPTIRLAKYWNSLNGYPYESYAFERWIVGRSFWLCDNLQDYFFTVIDGLSPYAESTQWVKAKIERAHGIVKKVRELEAKGWSVEAEKEVMKLIPAP